MKKLKVLKTVVLNGTEYAPNAEIEIEIDDKDFKVLIDRKIASEVKEPKKESPVIAEPKQVEEPKKADKATEKTPKAKTEAKKATKPATTKKTAAKTPAKAKATKAPTAKKVDAKKAN